MMVPGANATVRPNIAPFEKAMARSVPCWFHRVLLIERLEFISVISGAEYTTGAESNLLDEGIDRYLGISWHDLDQTVNRFPRIKLR